MYKYKWLLVVVFFVFLMGVLIALCFSQKKLDTADTSPVQTRFDLTQTPTPQVLSTQIGKRTKTQDCKVRGNLQDPDCTPGAVFETVTAAQICVRGYSKSVRNVSQAIKNAVYAEYGITSHKAGEYEVDHLISLELGGSNDIANLWPEAADPTPGFREKDKVENYLHKLVCKGLMQLQEAQRLISSDWTQVQITQ